MAHSDYDYINENGISDALKCIICTKPFESPVSVPCCHYSFCKQCIERWLEEHNTCPMCRKQETSSRILEPINTRIVTNQLNELLIRCKPCDQTNIQRGQWKHHDDICPKKVVPCQSAENGCSWKEARDLLAEHVRNCPYEQVRPAFDGIKNELRSTRSELQDKVNALERKVAVLLNIVNHGDLMKKRCSKPDKCEYHNGSNRKSRFTCTNCNEDVVRKEVSAHACSGKYICRSCVELQYATSESDTSTDSSEDN